MLPDLVALASQQGFAVVAVSEASQDEWDAFESGHQAKYAWWLAEHPSDHPEAAAVQALARQQQDAYFAGYRSTLGMAYLKLLAI